MLGKDTSTESSHDTKVIVTYMALYKVVPVGISSYEEHRRHSTLKKTLEHAARQEEVIRSTQDAFKVIHCPAQADSSFVGDQILCNTDGFYNTIIGFETPRLGRLTIPFQKLGFDRKNPRYCWVSLTTRIEWPV